MGNLKIPQLPPLGRVAADGDKLAAWDNVLSKTVYVDIAELPFGPGGGGPAPVALGSPFKVRNNSASYNGAGGNVVVTDVRLLGKSDYVVTTTQMQVEFDDDQITYNPVAGSFTITGFQLQDSSHITVYADGVVSESASELYTALEAQILLIQQMIAPFATTAYGANGGKVWWIGTADTIPAGWRECVAMRGYLPIAQKPADIYDAVTNPDGLSRPILTPGGSKSHTIVIGEIPPHIHTLQTSDSRQSGNDGADPVRSTEGGDVNSQGRVNSIGSTGGTPDPITGVPAAASFSIMNPYLIGIWIEFIGV